MYILYIHLTLTLQWLHVSMVTVIYSLSCSKCYTLCISFCEEVILSRPMKRLKQQTSVNDVQVVDTFTRWQHCTLPFLLTIPVTRWQHTMVLSNMQVSWKS